MRNSLMVIAALLIFAAGPFSHASAQDAISLSVSCTIPAIPGVNAPLVEEEAVSQAGEQATEQTPELTQEDSLQEVDSQDQPLLIVRTIYSR